MTIVERETNIQVSDMIQVPHVLLYFFGHNVPWMLFSSFFELNDMRSLEAYFQVR